jgi:sugar (pentulose or hexulose) kinase
MHYLALDVGSSFIKGAVVNVEHLTVEHVTRVPFPEPISELPPGYFEVDPSLIVAAVRNLIRTLMFHAPAPTGVLVSSQMGGVILTGGDGAPISNYYSWRDQRATQPHPSKYGSYAEVLRKRLGGDEIVKLGNELRAGSPLTILFWLAEKNLLPLWGEPLSLGDYVVRALCGGRRTNADPTLALGLIDLTTNSWHSHAFNTLGLEALDWPELDAVWRNTGVIELDGKGIPCYPPIGDHQAALAGSLLQNEELSINISTGSQISLLMDRFVPGCYQTRSYLDGRFLNTITHLPAGRSIDVLVNLVTEISGLQGVKLADPWPTIIKAAEAVQDTELSANLTFFDGSLGSQGSITNITTENLALGTLFRAAFRNMAENYATCAALLSPDDAWRRLVFSGGMAQNIPLLRQFIQEKLPSESRLCSSTEDALLGLLVITLVISGRSKTLQEASLLVSRKNVP